MLLLPKKEYLRGKSTLLKLNPHCVCNTLCFWVLILLEFINLLSNFDRSHFWQGWGRHLLIAPILFIRMLNTRYQLLMIVKIEIILKLPILSIWVTLSDTSNSPLLAMQPFPRVNRSACVCLKCERWGGLFGQLVCLF